MLHVRIDVPPTRECLTALAEGLVLLNIELMHMAHEKGVDVPNLYESEIVYRREPEGREWWENANDLLSVVKDRSGDCEDLSCYHAAWLRYFTGEQAHAVVVPTEHGSYHCIVEREDGELEDPSLEALHLESERTGVPVQSLYRLTSVDRRYAP
jgi:hypothetical protein